MATAGMNAYRALQDRERAMTTKAKAWGDKLTDGQWKLLKRVDKAMKDG